MCNKSRLFVINSIDFYDVSKQIELLKQYFEAQGKKVITITSKDKAPFKTKHNTENIYAITMSKAVNRNISWMPQYYDLLEEGVIFIVDEYVSTDIISQFVKIDKSEWGMFEGWVYDIEYNKLSFPIPEATIFITGNISSISEECKKYNRALGYLCLQTSYRYACVSCTVEDKLRDSVDISNDIIKIIENFGKV